MLRKIVATALITLGTCVVLLTVVGAPVILMLTVPDEPKDPTPYELALLAANATFGVGFLIGGLAVRRWLRWRRALGVIFMVAGGLELILLGVGFVLWASLEYVGRDASVLLAPAAARIGFLASQVAVVLVILGIWLIRQQKKIDRAAEGGDPLREHVKDRGPRSPAPELVASVREPTESEPRR